jgi:hypothetical protein
MRSSTIRCRSTNVLNSEIVFFRATKALESDRTKKYRQFPNSKNSEAGYSMMVWFEDSRVKKLARLHLNKQTRHGGTYLYS